MQVYFVYKSLAHPEGGSNSYVQPITLEERLLHIAEAKRTLGATVPWLSDTIDNDLKHALGDRPNSEFIIDPDGKIVVMRDWSRPDDLRRELEGFVGEVENPTRVADLDLKIDRTPKPAASGVVERVRVPSGLQPLRVEPQKGKTPYYVKLRAEADSNVLRGRLGKMYLGFHLDPIYHVHWNNLAKAVSYEVTAPEGVIVSPETATGPKIEVEADIDPREFLVDVDGASAEKPLELTVKYFACNDEKGFCIPVTQKYVVHFERDRDGGSARRSTGRSRTPAGANPGARNRPVGNSPQGRGSGAFSADRLMGYDRNKDGKITKEELPEQFARRFDRMDANGDGSISRMEAEEIARRIGQQRQQSDRRRPPNDPERKDRR